MLDMKCKNKDCNRMISNKMNKSKLCTKCAQKKWNEEHKEEISIYNKKYRIKYYQENKKEVLEVNRKYRENNKGKISKAKRKCYKNKTEYYKNLSKNYYEENREKRKRQTLEYYHKMYKNNEGYRMRRLLGTALSKVIRHYIKTGKITNPMRKYHIDWEGIMKVLIPIPKPRRDYNVDHIIPLYKFDLTDFEQIHIAFAPENHRWLRAKDNRKRDRPNTKERKKNKST